MGQPNIYHAYSFRKKLQMSQLKHARWKTFTGNYSTAVHFRLFPKPKYCALTLRLSRPIMRVHVCVNSPQHETHKLRPYDPEFFSLTGVYCVNLACGSARKFIYVREAQANRQKVRRELLFSTRNVYS